MNIAFCFYLNFNSTDRGIGIWITLCLSDIIPVFVFLAISLYRKNKYAGLKNTALMIPPSFSFHWTIMRGNFEEMDDYMRESNKKILFNIQRVFYEDYLIIARALEDITKDIFNMEDALSEIDISVIVDNNYMMLRFIYDRKLYNPFKNEELLNTTHIKELNNLNHTFHYHTMFNMNFSYVRVYND